MAEPDRRRRTDYETVPPGAGRVLAGILLLLFGACLLLVGGGCTILWLAILLDASSWGHESGAGLLLVSLATAAMGLFAVVKAVHLLRRPCRGDGAGQ